MRFEIFYSEDTSQNSFKMDCQRLSERPRPAACTLRTGKGAPQGMGSLEVTRKCEVINYSVIIGGATFFVAIRPIDT